MEKVYGKGRTKMLKGLTGLDFIKEYRAHPERYLPFVDRTGETPSQNEYVEINIGWNAGLLSDGRPFFTECWAVDQITMLTFYFSTKDIENITPEEMDKLLLDSGYFTYRNPDHALPTISSFGRLSNSRYDEFYSVGITVGVDEEPALIDGAPIISWNKLNEYNRETIA